MLMSSLSSISYALTTSDKLKTPIEFVKNTTRISASLREDIPYIKILTIIINNNIIEV